MASLKPGVLLKLLEDMNDSINNSDDDRKPVLLQIRSIVPLLEEGDLWPNKGFCLKVSDSSHAAYVSLPQEQVDMILSNELKLGQFIYVQKLEKAQPVPFLRGITPIPTRRPCDGTPEDIYTVKDFVNFLEASNQAESIVEKEVISEKKIIESPPDSAKVSPEASDSEAPTEKQSPGALKALPGERRIGTSGLYGVPRHGPSFLDTDSDSDCTISSPALTKITKRRSWTESEILGVKEIFDSSVVKQEVIKPRPRCRSATVSPMRSSRYDSYDDNLSSRTRRREIGSTQKLFKGSYKSQLPLPKINCEASSNPMQKCIMLDERKGAETRISWDSLPPSIMKLGKEVVRQREVALLAANDALQEACASERLLNCLSSFSELHGAEEGDMQLYVDKFLELQDDLAQIRLLMQSLTNISPLKTLDTDLSSTGSVKEVLDLALERKKNAALWLKSAIAFDLAPSITSLKPMTTTTSDTTSKVKKSSLPSRNNNRPKGASVVKSQKKNGEIPPLPSSSQKDEHQEYARGSTMCAAADLAASMQGQCRQLFLSYVEKFLDEVESKTSLMESDSQRTAMMYMVKRVSDWLDVMSSKEANTLKDGCREVSTRDDSDIQACGRVRNKIYGLLLKHVERSALAQENM